MAEVITTSLLRLVFDKLTSKVLKEFGLLMGLDMELRKLESTLSTIQDVLEDAEARQVKEKDLKGWLRKLKDVAYDADDLLDEVATKAVKWRPEIENHMKEKVRKFLSFPKLIVFRHKIAHRIKEIRETSDEIAEERSKFHLREGAINDNKAEIGVQEQTGSLIKESEVYGRQEDKEKIVDFLINMSNEGDPAVIAIVGLGGLGKTTIAQLVYNDWRVCGHFEKRIWVYVSVDFDIRKLYRSIIESITGREYNLIDMDSMQRSLREYLGGKKFLLVLDDVWNENHEKWDRLRIALTGGARGSKVVVTTRSDRVASIMGTVAPPYLLTGLSEGDCWALFEKRAFGLGGGYNTPSLVAIGKEIVKKCGGVPLAAKALGSLMRFKRGEDEWLAIKDNEIWKLSDVGNEILPALKLSYNHLPSRLKQCFAYCSIFPKAFQIRKETLVQLWIAEGFIQSSDGNTHLEDVGFQFVDELLSRSLFQNGSEDRDGVIRQVMIHDLIHDLARSIAGDECSIVDGSTGRGISQNSLYSTFLCDGPIHAILQPLREAKKLRTFHLLASEGMSEDQNKAQEVLHVIFSSTRLLRALHLSSYPLKDLPDSIRKLTHLRYLNLSHTHLETLPPCIGTLQNLQTLDLKFCKGLQSLPDSISDLLNLLTLDLYYCLSLVSLPNSIGRLKNLRKLDLSFCRIEKLPESVSCLLNLKMLGLRHCYFLHELPENMKNMRSLIHLDIFDCAGLTCMPAGIEQLIQLRTLPLFVLDGKSRCTLRELGGLNIGGRLDISNLENVRNAAEARGANLKEKQNIWSLRLSWDWYEARQACEGTDDYEETVENFIEALKSQDGGADSGYGEYVLEALQPHTSLEELGIEGTSLEELGIEGYLGRMLPCWMMEFSLPNLVKLMLTSCIRCQRLPAFGKLPFLEVLELSILPAVKTLGSEFYGGDNAFPLLEELELRFMLELEEWSGANGGEIFPCLAKLSLARCPKLKALPSTFPTVRSLTMDMGDGIILYSLQNGAFPNLEHLSIGSWDEDCDTTMSEVLAERMSSLSSWSVETNRGVAILILLQFQYAIHQIDILTWHKHNDIPHLIILIYALD